MKKKLISMIISISLVFSVITGCNGSSLAETAVDETVVNDEVTAASAEDEAESPKEGASARTVTDRSGNEIVLPEKTDAIISMAPSITRVLIDLGLADKIVACDTYSFSSYGTELNSDIPQFDMMAPDQEQMMALAADVIFTSGMSAAGGTDVFESVRDSETCITDIPSSSSLKGIEDDIAFIGMVVGKDDEATDIISEMQFIIDEIGQIGSTITDEERKKVLFELYTPSADSPVIYTAGKDTYINEMIELIGAENVAASETEKWPALSEEAAVAMNPDVILTADMYTPDVINTILTMEGWENVAAIANGDVYQLNSDEVNQPNHHVVIALIAMAKAIYPDKYADFDSEELEPAA